MTYAITFSFVTVHFANCLLSRWVSFQHAACHAAVAHCRHDPFSDFQAVTGFLVRNSFIIIYFCSQNCNEVHWKAPFCTVKGRSCNRYFQVGWAGHSVAWNWLGLCCGQEISTSVGPCRTYRPKRDNSLGYPCLRCRQTHLWVKTVGAPGG